MSGCTRTENATQGASKLIVVSITGTTLTGAIDSNVVYSDVITSTGGYLDDHLLAVLMAEPIYPYQESVTFTWYQDVIVDQIDVEFTRADGLNREGIDVPFAFSQKVYERIVLGGASEINFVIMSHNAKSESPLIELVNHGQEHILKLEAKITFYSKDLAGNRLEPVVTGISVWCSNFADNQ
jgi:hypothetical protein